jgi:hypothetical protein
MVSTTTTLNPMRFRRIANSLSTAALHSRRHSGTHAGIRP